MKVEVIRGNNLDRERWTFDLFVDYTDNCRIYYQSYHKENRPTLRHKWRHIAYWGRLGQQYPRMDNPPLPADVEQEARDAFLKKIKETPISKD